MDNKQVSLDEALTEENKLISDIHHKIDSFTQEVFFDSLDEEMIAIIICSKAMKKLSDLSKARVIDFLRQRYLDKVLTHKELLEKLRNSISREIDQTGDAYRKEINDRSREIIESFLERVRTEAQDNTPEENEELLKSFKDDILPKSGKKPTLGKSFNWNEDQFEDWGRSGLSTQNIADAVGVSFTAVHYQLKKDKFRCAYEIGENSRKMTAAESQIEK